MDKLSVTNSDDAEDYCSDSQCRKNSPTGSEGLQRFLIIVNPRSGIGKATKILDSELLPRLRNRKVVCDVVITKRKNHARTLTVDNVDLHKYSAIIVVSGDGIVSEVLHGMLDRVDRSRCLSQIPIGIIPCGSGNGLLASIFRNCRQHNDEPRLLKESIAAICDSHVNLQLVNLIHVQTSKENLCCFLSLGYGLIADIDVESEPFRRILGGRRFDFSGLIRWFNTRAYHCRLSFLRSPPEESDDHHRKKPFSEFDGDCRSRGQLSSYEDGEKSSPNDLTNFFRAHYPNDDIPDFECDIPSDWTTIEDEFLLIHAVMASNISTNGPYMPGAKLNDGKIYLTYILRKDVKNRCQLFKFLRALDDGSHLKFPFFKIVPVTSFRIETEPQRVGGYITLDGETIQTLKVQATVTSLTASVIAN